MFASKVEATGTAHNGIMGIMGLETGYLYGNDLGVRKQTSVIQTNSTFVDDTLNFSALESTRVLNLVRSLRALVLLLVQGRVTGKGFSS